MHVEVKIIGRPGIVVDGRRVEVQGDRLAALVTALALDADQPVPMATLIERMWPDGPPADPRGAVRAAVLRLRHLLGVPDLVTTEPSGYRLRVPRENVDALADPAPAGTAPHVPASRATAPADPGPPVPAQLPSDLPDFVGRQEQVAELTSATSPVLVISGPPGIGKTALAVRAAHRLRSRFPDGVLYGDLRAYAPGEPVAPERMLSRFLRALGTPPDAIPVRLDDQVRAYRAALGGRRVLVLLDNATEDVLRPLRPEVPGCAALVTSRHDLSTAPGVHQVELGELTDADARDLLGGMIGHELVDEVPAAVDELVRLCGRLPLALRIAGANLAGRYPDDVADYAAELRDTDRLAALSVDGDVAVRRAFDLSYRALTPDAQRLFRRLGHVPGPDFGTATATAVLGSDARDLLDVLVGASLVQQSAPDRYLMHDLLRLYAAGMAEPDPLGGFLDHLLGATLAAGRALNPEFHRVDLPDGIPVVEEPEDALAWFDAERATLVATAVRAARFGRPEVAWLLTDLSRGYFYFHGHLSDWLTASEAALEAAAADRFGEFVARRGLALAHWRGGGLALAVDEFTKALHLAREVGTPLDVSAVLSNQAIVNWDLGRLDAAAAALRESLVLKRSEPPVQQAPTLFNLAGVHIDLGPLDRSMEHVLEVLRISRENDLAYGVAFSTAHIGDTYYLMGHLPQAEEHLRVALASHETVDVGLVFRAGGVDSMANVELDLGRPEAALARALHGLDLAKQAADSKGEVDSSNTLGRVHAALGDLLGSVRHHRSALTTSAGTGYLRGLVDAHLGLATSHRLLGDLDTALRHVRDSDEAARNGQLHVRRTRVLAEAAAVHLALGDLAEALRQGGAALDLSRRTGRRIGEAHALVVLGRVRRELGDERAAAECWRAALEVFEELDAPNAAEVRELLDQPPGDQRAGDQRAGDQRPGDQRPGDQGPGDQPPGDQPPG
ncbi:ATP-binding protein [Umezawaea sp.]|uniref:ATP-binding protein n=1 Tax=Umezawaea sp. TaxID=1955258 RepID=UPI002ED67E8B